MSKIEKAGKKLTKADREATKKAAAHRDHPAVRLSGLLSDAADQPELITASVGTLVIGLVGRRPDLARGGARMLSAHLVATAGKALLKNMIDRRRPAAEGKETPDEGDDNSFPSGHTAGAIAVARAASRDIEGAAAPAAAATAAVAATQPATGAHFISDVIAGAVIGWVAEALVSAVFDRIEPAIEEAVRRRFGAGEEASSAPPA